MIRIFFLLTGVLVIAGIFACKKPPSKTKSEVMQERLEDRISRWEQRVNENCLNKIMDEAVAIVDSTLLVDARLKRDTSDLPVMPARPVRPEFKAPEDTLPIQPLLPPDTSRQ